MLNRKVNGMHAEMQCLIPSAIKVFRISFSVSHSAEAGNVSAAVWVVPAQGRNLEKSKPLSLMKVLCACLQPQWDERVQSSEGHVPAPAKQNASLNLAGKQLPCS